MAAKPKRHQPEVQARTAPPALLHLARLLARYHRKHVLHQISVPQKPPAA